MPSSSPAQARLMAAVAHGWRKPGGGGPSKAVAREFNQADKQRAIARQLRTRKPRHQEPDADDRGGTPDNDKDDMS